MSTALTWEQKARAIAKHRSSTATREALVEAYIYDLEQSINTYWTGAEVDKAFLIALKMGFDHS